MQQTEQDFTLKLRPYQLEDVEFLAKKWSGACFNEQRTGKTPTSLRTLAKKGCTKILIVCPSSCVIPWTTEYKNWLEKPCIACVGTHTQQQALIKQWTNGLVISYDSLKETKNTQGFIKEILAQKPEAIIIDEAHKIKNPKSCVAKAIFKLSKIPHKLALTATPAPNYAYEVWSILHFLFPKVFKGYWDFLYEFFRVKDSYASMHTFKEIKSFISPAKAKQLQYILNQFATQRKRIDVFDWLPKKDYQKIKLQATTTQQKYLEQLTKYYEIENSNVICQNTLDCLIRCRQVCAAPALLDLQGKSPKLEWLKEHLNDFPERSIIVFTKFKSLIDILKKELIKMPDIAYITGATSLKNRETIRKNFQNKVIKVLIAQIDTCKEGLTFDTAEEIIFLDKYPPVSDILQAEDRFIATTKERSNKTHTIIELILADTYDAEIYELIEKHASEVEIVNNFKNYIQIGV